jgi:hypothetical protein
MSESGFDAMPDTWWPVIAAGLAKPWPEEAVWFDLRWWEGQRRTGGERRPGRPALMKRWGWTSHMATKVLDPKNAAAWIDPRRDPTADRQRSNSRPTAHRQRRDGSTPTIEQKPTADRQPADSDPTADRQPLEDPRSTGPQSVERENARARQPVPLGIDHAAELNRCLAELGPDDPWGPRDQRAIRDVLRDGNAVDDVLLVRRWAHESHDREAVLARQDGWAGRYGALCNDRFAERLTLARRWDSAGRPRAPPIRAGPAIRPSVLSDLATLATELAPAEPAG